jgi:hypothetical protein
MDTQARFENLATFADRFQTGARSFALTIVASEVAERLFALKNCCRSEFVSLSSISSQVGAVPAFWQTDLHGAGGEPVCLRPFERETL